VARPRPATVAIHTTALVPQYLYGFAMPGFELPPTEAENLGSGTVFHPAGFVITNAHVIARASRILVDLVSEGGAALQREARVVAVDVPNDLAILRLLAPAGEADTKPYPFLPLGRSNDLLLGETAIAVGSPFGLGFTVTTGVVSGLDRKFPSRVRGVPDFADMIQIDAATNPGNSGGPLLDVNGRWIGVTTAILNRQRTGAEGIGFAIPADRVRALVARAFKRRTVGGDWIGIEEEARAEDGAPVVRFVFPKGPAVPAGLKVGDVITGVNGRPTPALYDYRLELAGAPAGSTVLLAVVRQGRPLPTAVKVPLEPVPTPELSRRHLGIGYADVDESVQREIHIPLDSGVLVTELRPGGPADKIRVRVGDLIVALGSKKIRNSDEMLLFLQYVQPGDAVDIRVRRPVQRGRDGSIAWDDKPPGTLIAE
jgi:serine protease Do